MSKYDELKKLKELFDDGMLTVEELEAEKAKILTEGNATDNSPSMQTHQAPAPAPQSSPIIITNTNTNANINANTQRPGFYVKPKNKWVALLLCVFLGFFGAHKFYEGKTGMGVLYLFTFGLFFFGVFIDFFAILFKPNPYFFLIAFRSPFKKK